MNTNALPASTRGPLEHDVRTQIVDAATAHFRLYGYEKTTVSDLAREIGFSKAYIYKFFDSKRAIGERICSACLEEIVENVRVAIGDAAGAPDKLRRMFSVAIASSLRLFFEDRKLFDIAASAAIEHWDAVHIYERRLFAMLREIVLLGRETGDFESETELDDTVADIQLVLHPYLHPLLLQYRLDHAADAPPRLAALILRSLQR